MTVVVLILILLVCMLLFSRVPLGALMLLIGGSSLLTALFQWWLGSTTIDQLNQNQPGRAIASLVVSGLILSSMPFSRAASHDPW
jgi:hypothetical protein